MSELSLPDYAEGRQKLALPVVNFEGVPNSYAMGIIHFHSDQEISEMMVELSMLMEGVFKIALFTFSEAEESLVLIPFETAKTLRLREDLEHMGMQSFWVEGVSYHIGILVQS